MTSAFKPVPDEQGKLSIEALRAELLDLFCQLAYKTGDFLLSSGLRSSYYINGKLVTLDSQGALAIGRLLLHQLPASAKAVAGLTLGADPIVTAISVVSAYENRPIPGLIVRKEPKGHGTRAYIEGPVLPEDSEVVVVEDVVTTGQSALKAVERLRQAGYQVNRVIALVDRQQGGTEAYAELGLAFESVFKIDEIQTRWQELHAG
ncbi:orotate phosphoribosyltransferase [Synechococcales cyanobacterium C]|uniref:Orotate phosphoribosyltransferase n=1 Tax=Petrachloros mirabilis ULC683 TaxID=2781853 RepID=A0A8K1ZXV5_9CYAN|nr:orotate phosphoribosyltransferase [Petrachloros mirabilis]NCJ07184.1 orotate phosphoribosyltransferase [Petrachloros mirabilis ULC683]